MHEDSLNFKRIKHNTFNANDMGEKRDKNVMIYNNFKVIYMLNPRNDTIGYKANQGRVVPLNSSEYTHWSTTTWWARDKNIDRFLKYTS